MADNCLLVAKITSVVTQINFKEDVINSSVAKITFVVVHYYGCDDFVSGQNHSVGA